MECAKRTRHVVICCNRRTSAHITTLPGTTTIVTESSSSSHVSMAEITIYALIVDHNNKPETGRPIVVTKNGTEHVDTIKQEARMRNPTRFANVDDERITMWKCTIDHPFQDSTNTDAMKERFTAAFESQKCANLPEWMTLSNVGLEADNLVLLKMPGMFTETFSLFVKHIHLMLFVMLHTTLIST